MLITDKQRRILEIADDKGFLLLEDGDEIYSSNQATSRAISDLSEDGLLIEKDAPDISKKKKVWEITDKAKVLLD